MKRDQGDLLVGAVTAGALAVLVAVLLWIDRSGRGDTYPLFTTFVDISGITEQGPVFLRGYEIGRIREIQPVVTENGAYMFRVRMDILWSLADSEYSALPSGTTALIRPPALLGSGTIELRLPDEPGPPLEPGSTVPGMAEQKLSDQVSRIGTMLSMDMNDMLRAAQVMLDSLTHAAGTANRVLTHAESALPALTLGVADQLAAVASLTEELQGRIGVVGPQVAANLDSIQQLVTESRKVVSDIRLTLDQHDPRVHAILANLETTSFALDHVLREVAKRPLRALTGVTVPPPDSLRSLHAAAARQD